MPKQKISEFNSNPALNTDIDSINIAEGCAPSGINDAIRELMSQLKDWQSGTSNDPYVVGSSGSLTLNQGTANGVAYLNGSKVVTSGSALTFDGTSLGVGIASPTFADGKGIHINNATGSARLHLTSQTSGSASTDGSEFTVAGSDLYIINNEAAATIFYNAGSEQMRLTSTGLGIGTSSPVAKLDVQGANLDTNAFRFTSTTGTNASAGRFVNTGGNAYVGLDNSTGSRISGSSGGGYALNLWHEGAYPILFGTTNAERMRLDSSGNLGLGVTPSAWNLGKVLEVGNAGNAIWGISAGDIAMTQGVYYNSGEKYANSSYAVSKYEQYIGSHRWYTAPSGTAGNAITFTQAMSLNSSGALLVGVTATGLSNANYFYFDPAAGYGGNALIGHISGTASGVPYFAFAYNGSSIGSITQNGTTAVAYNTSSDYRLKNITGPVTTSGAYIDSLNPVEGTWKADGSTFVGLLAHEVQESSRTNVATGVKDGAEMQAMDYSSSELIANLIAEVKSLRQRVATLEAK